MREMIPTAITSQLAQLMPLTRVGLDGAAPRGGAALGATGPAPRRTPGDAHGFGGACGAASYAYAGVVAGLPASGLGGCIRVVAAGRWIGSVIASRAAVARSIVVA